MYVRMYVCMYEYMDGWMDGWMCVLYMHACMCTCTVCTYVGMYVHYVCTYVCMQSMHACTYVCTWFVYSLWVSKSWMVTGAYFGMHCNWMHSYEYLLNCLTTLSLLQYHTPCSSTQPTSSKWLLQFGSCSGKLHTFSWRSDVRMICQIMWQSPSCKILHCITFVTYCKAQVLVND